MYLNTWFPLVLLFRSVMKPLGCEALKDKGSHCVWVLSHLLSLLLVEMPQGLPRTRLAVTWPTIIDSNSLECKPK